MAERIGARDGAVGEIDSPVARWDQVSPSFSTAGVNAALLKSRAAPIATRSPDTRAAVILPMTESCNPEWRNGNMAR